MSNGPIDPLTGPMYVLEGRLVTMAGGPGDVIPDGAIYVDAGVIQAVRPTADPAPDGFEDAPRIRTGDSIYPGLMELHNHLSYNAVPLWDVPRKFTNNGQWRSHDDYRRLITGPAQVLGRTEGIVEAVIRFVECRSLLGGVTTSQGITLKDAGGIQALYRGIVRNVEQTDDPALPEAGTRIGNPETGDAAAYLERLQDETCYLQHLSEGVDDTARGWFLRLRLPDGEWAVDEAFCGIHSTALRADDFEVVADRGGSMVWSPLSNFLLYGGTVDLRAAKDSGIRIGLGSDWAPSGSKNLIGEMKVAWLASREAGDVFTPEEIVCMATRDAARILEWDGELGTIEPGKRADLLAVNGQQGDDYLRLIEARETSITLVVVNGVPRVGQPRLMERFGPGTEEIQVGRSTRILNLEQQTAHPLVGDLTLTEATDRLGRALRDLPALAADLDDASAAGFFAGSADAEGDTWRLVLDLYEEEEGDLDELAVAAEPLASLVGPMELDPITVADDSLFLRRMAASRNLPEFVKRGLPPLYGEEISIPESAEFLDRIGPETVHPSLLGTTRELATFLRSWGELRLDDRKRIVDQARVLLEQNYVHLPFKRAMHAVDPVQQLRLLGHRLDETSEGEMAPEIEFHAEMTRIFTSLRDLHTGYRLPSPFREKTAWLPFMIEEFRERGRWKYMVSKVFGDSTVSDRVVPEVGPSSLQPGVEVLHWNGVPIERAIERNGELQAAGNPEARRARGLNALTIRPLVSGLAPAEEWITLRYRDLDGQVHEWTQEWLVFDSPRGVRSLTRFLERFEHVAETALGLDGCTDDIQEAKRVLFAGLVALEEERAAEEAAATDSTPAGDGDGEAGPFVEQPGGMASRLPTVFRARTVVASADGADRELGYVRIFTFNVRDAGEFVDEFVRLVEQLPGEGLVLDVRGNGGGLIHAAERLLQVLTPRHVEPQRAQFINTPVNLQICRNHESPVLVDGFALSEWIDSIAQSVETGATYSLGYPITPEEDCNDIGQRYYGPVVLVTDALCYSAADIFAAGFQDHRIGKILGTARSTGAGGANVWTHGQVRRLMQAPGDDGEVNVASPYAPLPGGAGLRVAVRRTVRVGANAGSVVEDLGVTPDRVHHMTRRDLLEGNADLLQAAAEMLVGKKAYGIDVDFEPGVGPLPVARVHTRNIAVLDVMEGGRLRASFDVEDDRTDVDFSVLLGRSDRTDLALEFLGYDQGELAVRRKEGWRP